MPLDDTARPAPALPPEAAAAAAGLRHVSDDAPGIRRRRAGRGFAYTGPDGKPVRDKATLARIRSLAIAPAYRDVWVCADPRGHIQATGRDERDRKQYRYHPRWREVREAAKYEHMMEFAAALPDIRARVQADMRRTGLPREKVLATVVHLLETTLIRVGNEEYARTNSSHGLTTLQDDHVEVQGTELRFSFRGKSGKEWNIGLRDRRLARILRSLQDLPGQELFQYLDDDGDRRAVSSADVNDYLREITGRDITAKDFRTWSGTVLTACALQELEQVETQTAAKRNVAAAIKRVAERLGNTPAVCRKCYVHPAVLDGYLAGGLLLRVEAEAAKDGLDADEAAVLAWLRERLGAAAP